MKVVITIIVSIVLLFLLLCFLCAIHLLHIYYFYDRNNLSFCSIKLFIKKRNCINMAKIRITESELKRIVTESVKKILKENMSQQYSIDLKSSSRTNQQSISQLHSLLNSRKPMECVLNMFYGNGFTCDVTFSTDGNSVCTMNVTSSTQYNKTFKYPAGDAVQQALNIGRNLCNQWLQSIQQNRQQTQQQQPV